MRQTVSPSSVKPGTADADQAPAALDRSIVARTAAAVLALDTLRACVQELGYTEVALAVHLKGEAKHSAYVHRVLTGDKPLSLAWLEALPEDLKGLFYARRAEQLGHLVVAPIDNQADARRMVVAGLIALLDARQLPTKAGAPIKVSLAVPASEARRAAR